MLRSTLGTRPRIRVNLSRHPFDSSPRYSSTQAFAETVQLWASKAPECHNLFQYVHDSVGLPILVSIPLVTVLTRSLVTPLRYYLALRRQEQCEALPQLRSAANLIAKQSDRRVAAGVDTEESANIWRRKKWELKLHEIKRRYPMAEPTMFVKPETSFDFSSSIAPLIMLANTMTILSQSSSHPDTLGLHVLDDYNILLALCVQLCLSLNIDYFHCRETPSVDSLAKELSQIIVSRNPFVWSDKEARVICVILYPGLVALCTAFCPPAVTLCLLSSLFYSTLERKFIAALVRSHQEKTSGVSEISRNGGD